MRTVIGGNSTTNSGAGSLTATTTNNKYLMKQDMDHLEEYGPWAVLPWQRTLACYVASAPLPPGSNIDTGPQDILQLTLSRGNLAHRHTIAIEWVTPTDTTNLDYFEIRYRPTGSDTWSYTKARPHGNSKTLYNDQHGTVCGTKYQVGRQRSMWHICSPIEAKRHHMLFFLCRFK